MRRAGRMDRPRSSSAGLMGLTWWIAGCWLRWSHTGDSGETVGVGKRDAIALWQRPGSRKLGFCTRGHDDTAHLHLEVTCSHACRPRARSVAAVVLGAAMAGFEILEKALQVMGAHPTASEQASIDAITETKGDVDAAVELLKRKEQLLAEPPQADSECVHQLPALAFVRTRP